MTVYDLLIIILVAAISYIAGVITTIKVDETHERLRK